MTTSSKPNTRERMLIAQVAVLEAEAAAMEDKLRRIAVGSNSNRQTEVVGDVGTATSSSVYRVFDKWGFAAPGANEPFVIGFNSTGGNYINAFATYDIIRLAQQEGHAVTIANMGQLGTKAAILMQAAQRRVMSPRSWLVIKESEAIAQGNTNNHRDEVRFVRTLEEHGWRLLTSREGCKITPEELKDRTYRGAEWWIDAKEALALGLIDEISTEVQILAAAPNVDPDLLPSEGDSWIDRKRKAEIRKSVADLELMRMGRIDGLDSLVETGQVMLFNPVTPETCAIAANDLNVQMRRGVSEIDFVLNSPGGSVTSGNGLMDVLDRVKARGTKLTTSIYGLAASMGGFISQTGDVRRISANSYFMIHQVSSIFKGSSSHMEDNQASMDRLQEELFTYMADRTGGKLPIADLKAKCNEHDWWLTPTEAKDFGLVDEII